MGLLDLPAPLLSWMDGHLSGFAPPLVRVLFWSAVAAVGSMELYRVLSPQQRIKGLEVALRDTQRDLSRHEGSFADGWLLIRGMLGLAGRRVLLVLPGTLIASLPLLALIVWLDSAYGRSFPPAGEPVRVEVPGDFRGRWIAETAGTAPRVAILNGHGDVVTSVSVEAPVPVIHKRRWWNLGIGNPAGYLPRSAPVQRLEIDLPHQQILGFGPGWLRGWEVVFFVSLMLFALTFKIVRRIE